MDTPPKLGGTQGFLKWNYYFFILRLLRWKKAYFLIAWDHKFESDSGCLFHEVEIGYSQRTIPRDKQNWEIENQISDDTVCVQRALKSAAYLCFLVIGGWEFWESDVMFLNLSKIFGYLWWLVESFLTDKYIIVLENQSIYLLTSWIYRQLLWFLIALLFFMLAQRRKSPFDKFNYVSEYFTPFILISVLQLSLSPSLFWFFFPVHSQEFTYEF